MKNKYWLKEQPAFFRKVEDGSITRSPACWSRHFPASVQLNLINVIYLIEYKSRNPIVKNSIRKLISEKMKVEAQSFSSDELK